MNRMIADFLFSFVLSISAQAIKMTPENTDLYSIYCANGDGHFKSLIGSKWVTKNQFFLKRGD
jgi:hypothetical protein